MGDGVDLLGIAGGHRDAVGTLKVAVHLVMTGDAVTSPEQDGREQNQISYGHLSLS
jgi:hypothetical protein